MARKALVEKNNKLDKTSVKHRNRCQRCGRPRGFIRFFGLCRLCVRNLASRGLLTGVKKASW